MLLAPCALPIPDEPVVGADAMHRLLVSWLEQLGHRRDLAASAAPGSVDAGDIDGQPAASRSLAE